MTATSVLPSARLEGEQLVFLDGSTFWDALAAGCFHLAFPAQLDFTPGVRLSQEFYLERVAKSDLYRGHRASDGIYFDREHFQTEHILADGPAIKEALPAEVHSMCAQMFEVARVVLRDVLAKLGVPSRSWEQATGGCTAGRGTEWFASSHYRSERDMLGCPAHKDTGFVTMLYIEDSGLEALGRDGAWFDVEPRAGHLVVNFGGALEYLTERLPRRVRAILHRVRRCPSKGRDRFSFAAFVNPPATGSMYQLRADGTPEARGSIEAFLREFNKQTWNDRHADFGIAAST